MAKAVDIKHDGTLVVKTRHYEDIKRVLVERGTNGTLFYADERPKGKWITSESYQGGVKETWYKCSECGWHHALLLPNKFCPNCGADMREAESEDK